MEPESKIPSGSDGWNAQLDCTFESGPSRTVVRRSHQGPLSIQRPFYPEGSIAHVYMLHPPGGVVGGDHLTMNIACIDGGQGLISTPGATKFYRSDGPCAKVIQSLKTQGGSLEWFPQENIFFTGCKADVATTITLNDDDALAWWEINCFGRPAGNEPFEQGSVGSSVNVYRGADLVLRERVRIDNRFPLGLSCGMRGCTVSGTLLLTPLQAHCIEFVRKRHENRPCFSSTFFDSMLLVRYLGDSSEEAKSGFAEIWSGLRKTLINAVPSIPRIWAT